MRLAIYIYKRNKSEFFAKKKKNTIYIYILLILFFCEKLELVPFTHHHVFAAFARRLFN